MFQLGIISESDREAAQLLNEGSSEIKRLENLLTEFHPQSQTSKINDAAGLHPVLVNDEVYQLITRSKAISKLTRGYLDITMGALKNIYSFKNSEFKFPDPQKIKNCLDQIGYQRMALNSKDKSVLLQKKGMRISFAAIGKGYAADQVISLWKKQGVKGGFVNASGDLCAFGTNEKNEAWTVGIGNPNNPVEEVFHIPVTNEAVATSGDYEQHFIYQGQRYSHTINPINGLPVTGVRSVSVFSPSAELSDALATAIFAMGLENGIAFVNQLPKTHAIFIDDSDRAHFSNKIHYETAF